LIGGFEHPFVNVTKLSHWFGPARLEEVRPLPGCFTLRSWSFSSRSARSIPSHPYRHGFYRVAKINKEGNWLKSWGGPGDGPGQFITPHSIAVDAQGSIYVADCGNRRIQVFDGKDGFLCQITVEVPVDQKPCVCFVCEPCDLCGMYGTCGTGFQ
jgi:hypothetical protein